MNKELREKIVNQGRALYEKAQTIEALQAEVQEGAEALLRTHRILSAKEAENAALREIVQAVASMKWSLNEDWCLFCGSTLWQDEPENHTEGCPITKARELLRKTSEEVQ